MYDNNINLGGSPTPKISYPVEAAPKSDQTSIEMNELDMATHELDEIVSKLMRRLQPILVMRPETADAPMKENGDLVPHAADIRGNRRRVMNAVMHLHYLVENIQI